MDGRDAAVVGGVRIRSGPDQTLNGRNLCGGMPGITVGCVMERFRSAAVFRRKICASIHQEPGHFESESRCRYMERRVAGIQVMSDLREKVSGSICPGRDSWRTSARDRRAQRSSPLLSRCRPKQWTPSGPSSPYRLLRRVGEIEFSQLLINILFER